jgi:hypothetical protein
MRHAKIVGALIGTLMAGAGSAAAQAPQSTGPDLLPRELVEALLRAGAATFPGDGSEFVVGRVPTSLAPYFYVPRNATVLGGLENTNNVVAIFKVNMTREELRTTYAKELPKLGWTPATGRSGWAGWGFMPAPGTGPTGSGLEYCHIGQALQINPTETPSGGGLSVTAVVRNYGGACRGPTTVAVNNSGLVDMPVLVNPPDAGMNQTDCFQPQVLGVASRASSERLKTSIPADRLLDHFGRQLADSGWSPAGSQAVSLRRTWTRADTGSTMRELTLTIMPSTVSGCHEVSMQVRQTIKR